MPGRSADQAPIPIADVVDALTTLRPSLIHTARRQLQVHGLDCQLAEDLVQDAIARWFTRRPEYRGPGQLYTWLRTTMARMAADLLRSRRDALDWDWISLDERVWAA